MLLESSLVIFGVFFPAFRVARVVFVSVVGGFGAGFDGGAGAVSFFFAFEFFGGFFGLAFGGFFLGGILFVLVRHTIAGVISFKVLSRSPIL
jgi:hypothetical protein